MPEWFSSPNERYRFLLVTILVAGCLGILIAAWAALLPFFLGAILAYLLMPAVDFLEHQAPKFLRQTGWTRPLAIILVYLCGIGLIAGMLSYFIPLVTEQANSMARRLPYYADQIQKLVTYDIEPYLQEISPDIRAAIDANIDRAVETLANALQKGLSGTLRTLWQTVSFVLGMLVIPFWLFYILNDRDKVDRAFYSLIPEKSRGDVRCVQTVVDDLLSAYLRGKLVVCLVVGLAATILLLILGVDLAVLLGTIVALLDIVPLIGPWLGGIPAVLIALLDRPAKAVWVAVGFFAIQEIESLFLTPRISGSAVRFHPAVVMVILVVGAEVAGLWGMVLGVPVAAIIRDVFQYLYLRTTEKGVTPEMALDNLRARML